MRIETASYERLSFTDQGVRKLLELIAGGTKPLSVKQLDEWRALIMYAVKSVRDWYEADRGSRDVRKYYNECWLKIEAAGTNDHQLVDALDYLRISIEMK